MTSAAAARRVDLETLLRERHLDRTLVPSDQLPVVSASLERGRAEARPSDHWPLATVNDIERAATGIAALDERLGGGWPRGEQSEIVGRRSSGRTRLLLASMAAATVRGEAVALIDASDTLDVASAAGAGVDLDLMLWVRQAVSSGQWAVGSRPVHCPPSTGHCLDRAIKAFNTVLQAGGFGLVVLDLCDVPANALRSLPYTTWMRLQRVLLGASTVALIAGAEPIARSARGVTVDLGCAPPRGTEVAGRWERGLFSGLHVAARVLHGRHVRWGSDEVVTLR